jgi:uncharacterized protein (TIGR02117 family)
MKKLLRTLLFILLYAFLALISAIVLYMTAAIASSCIPVNRDTSKSTADSIRIFLRSNGVHADIVVPFKNNCKDWSGRISPEKNGKGGTDWKYIGFGWGDRAFYIETPEWSDIRFSTAFDALFWRGSAAMHVSLYDTVAEAENCIGMLVDTGDYMRMTRYIESDFTPGDSGNYLLIPQSSYGHNDLFFEAKGTYNLFFTCNTWTNDCLKAGHRKACLWTPFEQGIFFHYR